ncbi:hypothetical protein VTK56DRAFT_9958 [Thermocarpiscus australiensis]
MPHHQDTRTKKSKVTSPPCRLAGGYPISSANSTTASFGGLTSITEPPKATSWRIGCPSLRTEVQYKVFSPSRCFRVSLVDSLHISHLLPSSNAPLRRPWSLQSQHLCLYTGGLIVAFSAPIQGCPSRGTIVTLRPVLAPIRSPSRCRRRCSTHRLY